MIRLAPRLLWRMLTRQRTMGGALVVGLLKGCLDQGCVIWNASSAEGLNKSDGRVVGVEVKRDGKQVRVVARKGVVLASGGFEWNPEMMARHFPGVIEWSASPDTQTGDGQRMAARRRRDVGSYGSSVNRRGLHRIGTRGGFTVHRRRTT